MLISPRIFFYIFKQHKLIAISLQILDKASFLSFSEIPQEQNFSDGKLCTI